MEQFDKTSVTKVMEDMKKAMAIVAKRHGIQLHQTRGSWQPSELNVKFSVIPENFNDSTGELQTPESRDYEVYAFSYGLKKEWLGQEFSSGRKRFKVHGLKTRSHKYPVLAQDLATGKIYKFTANQVKSKFKDR